MQWSAPLFRVLVPAGLLFLIHARPEWIGVWTNAGGGGFRVLPLEELGLPLPRPWVSVWLSLALVYGVTRLWDRSARWVRWLEIVVWLAGVLALATAIVEAWPLRRVGVTLDRVDASARIVLGRLVVLLLSVGALAALVGLGRRALKLRRESTRGRPARSRRDVERKLGRTLGDVYRFYLSPDEREQLGEMGSFEGLLHLIGWFFRGIYRKLTPTRRILFLVALLTPGGNVSVGSVSIGFGGIGFSALFVLVLLELKDKLTAVDELEVGRAVQAALLPDSVPDVPGWDVWLFTRAAREVGGDLVDYVELDSGRWAFVLGDVAGKGLGAALVMSKLQASLKALAPHVGAPDALAARLNEIMCRDKPRHTFASLVYVEARAGSRELVVVNAGHPPALILGSGDVREMPRGSPALGLLPGTSYQERRETLGHGEVLVVYSDGVTEALNEGGEFFGDEKLREWLNEADLDSARMLGERLVAEVDRFVGDEPASDDLSLLVLRRVASSSD